MPVAAIATSTERASEPSRTLCPDCDELVLIAIVNAVDKRGRVTGRQRIVVAEPYEWEPRARCYACKNIETRSKVCPSCQGRALDCPRCEGAGEVSDKCANCKRCGGERYVGRERPQGVMLAVDMAWGDEGHVRLIKPRTPRRKGEALYELHACLHDLDSPAIVPAHPNLRSVAA